MPTRTTLGGIHREELLMTRRAKIWLVVAVLFVLVNLGGLVMAALAGELLHAALHLALGLLGAVGASRLAPRRVASY